MPRQVLSDEQVPFETANVYGETFGLTPHETLLLQQSWRAIEGEAASIGELFYGKLFELAPQLRKHFPQEMAAQREKLMATLGHAVAYLDRLDDLEDDVRALGRRHVGYGASEVDYSVVGDALIWTLEQGLGDAWSEDVEHAWEKVFSALSQVMIRASRGGER